MKVTFSLEQLTDKDLDKMLSDWLWDKSDAYWVKEGEE